MSYYRDGQEYASESEAPDLGGLICIGVDGNKRHYQGHTQDVLKLPIYDNLGHGSTAKLIDPDGVEKTIIGNYDAYTKHWLNLKGGILV